MVWAVIDSNPLKSSNDASSCPTVRGTIPARTAKTASELQHQYPSYQFQVWSSPIGRLTGYQGHDLGVECLFKPESTGDVVLSIDLCHLTSKPRVMAGVTGGAMDAAFQDTTLSNDKWPEATQDVIQELIEYFPKLVEIFESAIERGTA